MTPARMPAGGSGDDERTSRFSLGMVTRRSRHLLPGSQPAGEMSDFVLPANKRLAGVVDNKLLQQIFQELQELENCSVRGNSHALN